MPTRRTTPARTSRASRTSTTSTTRTLKAEIGRFDSDLKKVVFNEGDTVNTLLDKAGISLSSGEEINDDRGNSINPSDVAKEMEYIITGNYKNGQ